MRGDRLAGFGEIEESLVGVRFVGWWALGSLAMIAWTAPTSAEAATTDVCDGYAVTIIGTPGADVLTGTAGDDVIDARAGDDVVNGLGGADIICGGAGADVVDGGAGTDRLSGGRGNDALLGGEGGDTAYGGPGDDALDGGAGQDFLHGDVGDDDLRAGTDEGQASCAFDGWCDYMDGGNGNDLMHGGLGIAPDVIFMSGDHDVRVNLARGTARGDGRDTLVSVEAVQVAYEAVSNDRLVGSPGDNLLSTGRGEDVIFGRGGADEISESRDDSSGLDADLVRGGRGNDIIVVNDGADDVRSGPGDDNVTTNGESDAVARYRLGSGDDRFNQVLSTGPPIYVWAGAGADLVQAGTQAYLQGGKGADELNSGQYDDVLDGGPGVDWGSAGPGNDSCPSIEVKTECET